MLLHNTAVYAPYREMELPFWKRMMCSFETAIIVLLMHYGKDIRANYAVCICWQYVIVGSVAVIHFSIVVLIWGKWL